MRRWCQLEPRALLQDLEDAQAYFGWGKLRTDAETEGRRFRSLRAWLRAEQDGQIESAGIPELCGEWLVGPARREEFLVRARRTSGRAG
jgi:hypothetical protein